MSNGTVRIPTSRRPKRQATGSRGPNFYRKGREHQSPKKHDSSHGVERTPKTTRDVIVLLVSADGQRERQRGDRACLTKAASLSAVLKPASGGDGRGPATRSLCELAPVRGRYGRPGAGATIQEQAS